MDTNKNKISQVIFWINVIKVVLCFAFIIHISLFCDEMDQAYRDMGVALPVITMLLVEKKIFCCIFVLLFPVVGVISSFFVEKLGRGAVIISALALLLLLVVIAIFELAYFLPLAKLVSDM